MQRTAKQQYLDLSKGIQSDYLLWMEYGMPSPYSKTGRVDYAMTGPGITKQHMGPQGGKDIWGVNYVSSRSAGFNVLPEPGKFMFDDITKWRDYVHAPDISDIDFEQMAAQDLKMAADVFGVNPETTCMAYNLHSGYFQELMALMGFNGGLIALHEEPEECKALVEYLCDFYVKLTEASFDFYHPDMVEVIDDTAAWGAPFMNPDQYREIFKPAVKREAQFAIDRGLPIEMHCCGKCECFIDDWVELGIGYWDPAQTCNDLVGIQKKYGKDFIVCGGIDIQGKLVDPEITEEEYKALLEEQVRTLTAQGAPYVFCGWQYGDQEDQQVSNHGRWLTEVVEGEFGLNLFK